MAYSVELCRDTIGKAVLGVEPEARAPAASADAADQRTALVSAIVTLTSQLG